MPTAELTETVVAPGIVRRSDRGLCLTGTRISLYLIMDYLKADWPPPLLRHWLGLSEEQIHHATDYIEMHRTEFEAEYAEVVRKLAEREKYWRELNSQREPDPQKRDFTPEQAAAWTRLAAIRQAARGE